MSLFKLYISILEKSGAYIILLRNNHVLWNLADYSSCRCSAVFHNWFGGRNNLILSMEVHFVRTLAGQKIRLL